MQEHRITSNKITKVKVVNIYKRRLLVIGKRNEFIEE